MWATEQNLILQANCIVNDYTEQDINLCLSVLTDEEKEILNKHITILSNKREKISNQKIYNAIAILVDLKEIRNRKNRLLKSKCWNAFISKETYYWDIKINSVDTRLNNIS